MYTRAYDQDQHLLVTLFSGPSNLHDDFVRAAEDTVAADAHAAGFSAGVVHVTEIEPGNPTPDARCRKLLQDAVSRSTCAPRYVVCFITSSAIVRGVITALRWFQPPRAPHVAHAFARFEEAIAFAEGHRPGTSKRLCELRSEARTSAEDARAATAQGDHG
jgi:hypothetical protein